ncbi:glutathione binding-like protein [Lysobacter yananisis]|uniref:Glutathione S-transferase n=2 Tax=Lysobacter TaxID=68 RepID=A0A0S2DNX7_LYSEN|nr:MULTISPECIES: glutathione binding-like protein [Lysobacter]ALN60290.1 glutathione S-transferase [Lysobacter enzymogenes]QCW28252.1 thiol:disulfide oxidoreductase [Lysobacter enzymogenes]WMT04889.1 glutathione binding-like protein [Lysobacter yananisis]
MIDLHYWPTPNGHKITLFLEEAADAGRPQAYRIEPVNIGAGDQFKPEFLAISPNNRMPAIVDHAPADGGAPISVFESGAILRYLAEKTGLFAPADLRGRVEVDEWLFWQVGGYGPMLGQNHHFNRYAPEKVPYAIDRYQRETERLYGVLDKRLAGREFIAGEALSIADFACYPWAREHDWHHVDLARYPAVQRWHDALSARPAFQRAYEMGKVYRADKAMTDEMRKHLFGTPGSSAPHPQ